MATQESDVATAEAGDDASADFSGGSSRAGPQQGESDALDRGIDSAKDYAKDVAGRAKEQGRALFDEQKESAAGTVDSAASAFRNTAQQLQGEGQAQTGRYVEMFAAQLQSFGNQLRNKNLDALIRDAEDFGRRSPGTFLAGSMIAGFVMARFLKSSAEHRYDADRTYGDSGGQSSYAGERAASTSRVTSSRDEGALLSGRPYAGSPSVSNASSDPDMSGSVMEGSDAGGGPGLAGASAFPPSIATANAGLTEGERHDNR
jgi:hypothetical protein